MQTSERATPLRAGDQVGRYEVVTEVARGGMAAVYVARLSSIGGFDKLFALKVLLPRHRANQDIVNMLLDEARISASIQHDNVVQVLDIAEHDGSPYIAMEFLRGQSLRRVSRAARKRGERLPVAVVLGVLARVAEGLHAAHSATDGAGTPLSIVHRDISPENIHVGYDGQVKVVDFGIAAAEGRLTETTHGEIKGKVRYLPPEVLDRSQPSDHRMDVWSLGLVAEELLTGRQLFKGEDVSTTMWNILNKDIPNLRSLVPQLPRETATLIRSSLSRDVAERPTCLAIMRNFDAAASSLGGASKDDLTRYMTGLFATERAVEDERIAAVIRAAPVPLMPQQDDGESDSGPLPLLEGEAHPAQSPGSNGKRAWLLAIGGLLIVALGASAVASSLAGADPQETLPIQAAQEEPAVEPPEISDEEVPLAEPAVEELAPPEILVEVDDRARLVLVDGTRRDERPLSLVLENPTVVVELLDGRGNTTRHELTEADDGRRLRIERRRQASGGPSKTRPSAMMAEPSRDIVRGVF